jgi:hypothetical protein
MNHKTKSAIIIEVTETLGDYVEGKFFLVHAMNAYGTKGSIVPHMHNIGKWSPSSPHGIPTKKSSITGLEALEREKKNLFCLPKTET